MKDKTMEKRRILVVNPGSTTTKIGVFDNLKLELEKTITHNPDHLLKMGTIMDQEDYRVNLIKETLKEEHCSLESFKAIVGRGGMVRGLKGGGYEVNEDLCQALRSPENPQHASSLGGLIAFKIAQSLDIPAFIYDSPTGCELTEVAKISGLKGIDRYGLFHVLNAKAQARNYAESIGKKYENLQLLVCHMGGGITVTAHKDGEIIDGLSYDDGPMSPERSGGIPLLLWTELCYSGTYTKEETDKLISGKGGMYSYLGVTDGKIVEERVKQGDKEASLLYEAMAYQVAKSAAQVSVALKGNVDGIILTGGLAHSKMLNKMIMDYAPHIGKYIVMPGEDELLALAKGTERILAGEEKAHRYQLKRKK